MTFKWETTHTTTARLFTHTESPSDVSAVLRRLGFSRKPNPVRREGERVRLYFPPAPPQPGPGTLPPPWPPRG